MTRQLRFRAGVAFCALALGIALVAGGAGDDGPDAAGSTPATAATPSSPAPVTPAPGDHDLKLAVGGVERDYRLHAPPSYDTGRSFPLVLAFHCQPCDISDIERLSGLSAKADEESFIVVYPQGKGSRFSSADVEFVEALLDEVQTRWRTDPRRVYATGISNGASMTFRAAVDLPGRFAAIAPVSGPLNALGGPQLGRVPPAPVSMVVFTGESDAAIDRSVGEDLGEIRKELGCARPSVKTTRSARPVTITSTSCPDGMDVTWYSVGGMGHAWPGAAVDGSVLADSDAPIKATDVMWDFFTAHPGTA
jgi:polyhydroxybutyrate depolymerase